jgi:teichuronic acid biosynthesis glycosyltransferase TuaC
MRVLVVTAMYPRPDATTLGLFVEEQVESIKRQGVEIDVMQISPRSGRLRYLVGALGIFRATLTRHYDVVHAHYGPVGLLARCQIRAPVVVTLHGSDVNLATQRPLSRVAVAVANETIAVSHALAARMGQQNIHVIPCGVNLSLFRPMPVAEARRALGLAPDVPVVLFAASPSQSIKRFDRFLSAIRLLRREVAVLTLGDVPHLQVPLYLNAAECAVLTSDSEGSPVVVREALACNTPIVTVEVGDVREQLLGVTPGAVVGHYPTEIASAISAVLAQARRSNGRGMVEHLGLDAVAYRVLAVYRRAAGRG